MRGIYHSIERLNTWVGERVMWLTSALVVLIFADVVLRYLFSSTSAWVMELEWHLFALIFLLCAGYTLKHDQHVRVDLFYARMSRRGKAWVDLLGTLLFLLPWCAIVIYTSFKYAENSFAFREMSPDPGGLPARYIIKFAITAGFSLLMLQGVALVLKSLRVILVPTSEPKKD